MRKFKIDSNTIYKIVKRAAVEGQLSGVDVGHVTEGSAGWLGEMLHVSDGREYIRTSAVKSHKKISPKVWEIKTVNGSTYRLTAVRKKPKVEKADIDGILACE
jgi:hypothetical protein